MALLEWSAEPFFKISTELGKLISAVQAVAGLSNAANAPGGWSRQEEEVFLSTIADVRTHCDELGLRVSVKLADRLGGWIAARSIGYAALLARLADLRSRVQDELGTVRLLRISADDTDLLNQPALFGQEVSDRFPEASYDVEEAGNCLALERSTAVVFHLMRIMEVALRAIAKDLGVPDPTGAGRNWGRMLLEIDRAIEARRKGDPAWAAARAPLYANLHADLSSIRTAWRNPVMHVEGTYDQDRARHIFVLVRGFTQHLAREL